MTNPSWRLTGVGQALVALLAIACDAKGPEDEPALVAAPLLISAGGAVSCDFDLPAEMDPTTIGPIIERDRMYMAERPGLVTKHLPLSVNVEGRRPQTGGRYLFDTVDNARRYLEWLGSEFRLDGFIFLQRPFFLEPRCTAWEVVGAAQWEPAQGHHHLMRTERLQAPDGRAVSAASLSGHWRFIMAQARNRGLAAVRLNLSSPAGGPTRVEIVQIGDRSLRDILGLTVAPSVAAPLEREGWRREFDRHQVVLTIWYPFLAGDRGPPALWPSSPPLPGPSCGDRVCQVSRGENGQSCAGDCAVGCGDAICQPAAGENTMSCPGDCRLP